MALITHKVQLVLSGTPIEAFREIVDDLQEELASRPHLEGPRVPWNAEKRALTVDLQATFEATRFPAETAARALAYEVAKATYSVIGDFKRIHIDVIDQGPG